MSATDRNDHPIDGGLGSGSNSAAEPSTAAEFGGGFQRGGPIGAGPIEVDRLVNACGTVGLAGRQHPIGCHLAGQRVLVRLDGGPSHWPRRRTLSRSYSRHTTSPPGCTIMLRVLTANLSGRIPDLVVATEPVPDDTVWLAPELVTLAVEIVSKGSERTDRWFKPFEYAAAGTPRFWLIEQDDTVIQFRLAAGVYEEQGRVSLAELLSGDVPDRS